MFGYIVPEKPEMKIKEYELFRAYYCGVCKSIGKRYGQFKRLTLNYDSTFLAILLSAVSAGSLNIRKFRCIAHPVERKHVIIDNEIVDYASDMNIILAYYNLKDKSEDGDLAASGLASAWLSGAFKKARKKHPEKCGRIEKRLADLAALEKEKCPSMDAAAEPFAKLMEEVICYDPVCEDEKKEKILRWLGYNLGKWIYILDAYDDIEKDAKKGGYNPLLHQFNFNGKDAAEFKEEIKGKVEFNLTYCLSQVSGAFGLLDIKFNKEIIENIIYLGMLKKTEKILAKGFGSVEKSV